MADERVARLVIPHDRLLVAATALIAGWLLIACAPVSAEDSMPESGRLQRRGLHEPIFRISKTTKTVSPTDALNTPDAVSTALGGDPHPLDPALEIARRR